MQEEKRIIQRTYDRHGLRSRKIVFKCGSKLRTNDKIKVGMIIREKENNLSDLWIKIKKGYLEFMRKIFNHLQN